MVYFSLFASFVGGRCFLAVVSLQSVFSSKVLNDAIIFVIDLVHHQEVVRVRFDTCYLCSRL